MHYIGYYSNSTTRLTPTLLLPSSLSSVAKDGIMSCNLFTEVIYCGSNDLSINSSIIEKNGDPTVVEATSSYTFSEILGYSLPSLSPDENTRITGLCQNYISSGSSLTSGSTNQGDLCTRPRIHSPKVLVFMFVYLASPPKSHFSATSLKYTRNFIITIHSELSP